MSFWPSYVDMPSLAATDVSTVVAATAALLVLTAPDPALTFAPTPTPAVAILTAPDPNISGAQIPEPAIMLITAPEPSSLGGGGLIIDTCTMVMTAIDPTFVQPSSLTVTSALINLTTNDPGISYGFVSSTEGPTFPGVPPSSSKGDQHRRQIADTVNRTLQGKIACTGTLTLLPSVPGTFWRDSRLGAGSWVEFDPLTVTAVAEKVAGTMYVLEVDRQDGQWLITHANDPAADRTFRFSILG